MDFKQAAKDTARVITSYLTFQAVKTVLDQLKETNPAAAYWLNTFSSQTALQDGEAYLQALLQEQPDLAMRIMTVRQHIAEAICEFLPEMVVTSIQQSNTEHRRQHLERITQWVEAEPENISSEGDSEASSDSHVNPTAD